MTGINVIGMPFGMHGLGLELRDKVLAMVSAGIDVCIINQNYSSLKREIRDPRIEALVTCKPRHDINLICHNLPAIKLISLKEPGLLEGRYNIGAPYWEFPQLPDTHLNGLEQLDEIWVSNSFLKECFSAHTDSPITQMPLHLEAPVQSGRLCRLRPKFAGKPLVFGYVFDFNSMAARKDPMLLLTAFLECFADKPRANVKLVIKYNYEPSHLVRPQNVEDFLALASLDSRIELVDAPLSAEEMDALTDCFDVFVSPHRAEGLGRGIIEAMMKGKAVAATSYSGPAEFLSPDHALPLEHYDTHVGAAALGDIKSHFTWVDVHLESLIDVLTTLAEDHSLAVQYGEKAAKAIAVGHSAKLHGKACSARLAELSK
jgi:glycosyltransferase involved in cell wall biosynthesis